MAFVYGDSYGGVQGASQAATNSDRNLLMSLMAAQQAAQQIAMQQGNTNRQFDYNARLTQLNFENAEQERALRENLGLMELDALDSKIQATKEMGAQKLAADAKIYAQKIKAEQDQKLAKASSAGPVLASRFNELLQSKRQAEEEFERTQAEALELNQTVANAQAQGLVIPVKGEKFPTFKPSISADESAKSNVAKWNNELRRYWNELEKKSEKVKNLDRDLRQHRQVLQSSGFLAGDGALVYPETGQVFQLPVANSQKVRRYNFATKSFE